MSVRIFCKEHNIIIKLNGVMIDNILYTKIEDLPKFLLKDLYELLVKELEE